MKYKIKYISLIIVLLSLSTSIYCYLNFQFWNHIDTKNLKNLKEFKSENIFGIRGNQILINKGFDKYLNQIDKYASDNRIKIIVTQSYRYPKQLLSKTIVTPAKKSNHLVGFAFDFNILKDNKTFTSKQIKKKNLKILPVEIQCFINNIRENQNIRWGGDFNTEDPIHIVYPLNKKSPDNWEKQYHKCLNDWQKRTYKWMIWK